MGLGSWVPARKATTCAYRALAERLHEVGEDVRWLPNRKGLVEEVYDVVGGKGEESTTAHECRLFCVSL